ncbi:MAG: hypothetical protein VX223_18700, partial [Myxococcota bacterium]|nr:hypothetical protein [Myxococcota bacterium]
MARNLIVFRRLSVFSTCLIVSIGSLLAACGDEDGSAAGGTGITDTGPFVFAPSDASADGSVEADTSSAADVMEDDISASEDAGAEEDTTPDEDVPPSGPIDCSDGTPCPANSFCGEDSGVCECKDGF